MILIFLAPESPWWLVRYVTAVDMLSNSAADLDDAERVSTSKQRRQSRVWDASPQ